MGVGSSAGRARAAGLCERIPTASGGFPGRPWKAEYNLSMGAVRISLPRKKIAAFCKRWNVVEFALFGSALRADFSAQSDIDALVSFAPHSDWGLFDHVQIRQELQELFGRNVDLVTRRALEQSCNALLRSEILATAKVLYSEHASTHV